jgi:hypothetical protein
LALENVSAFSSRGKKIIAMRKKLGTKFVGLETGIIH